LFFLKILRLATYDIPIASKNKDYLFTWLCMFIFDATCQRGSYASDILTAAVNKITLTHTHTKVPFSNAP